MEINTKDKRILGELLDNSRRSNKQIGQKVNLSREAVAQRIKNLEQKGIIKSYITEINSSKLGLTQTAILIKTSSHLNKLETLINKTPQITFYEKAIGNYNILLSIKTKTQFQLSTILKQIKQTIEIQNLQITTSIANYDTQSSIFKSPVLTTTIKDTSNPIKLSTTETQIIKELSKNSKISLVDLASKVNLSALTVSQKIKQLRQKDIIKTFRILIDYKSLNLNRYSIALNIKPSQEKSFIEFCTNHPQISDTSELLGPFNFTTEILAKSNESFRQVLDQIITKFKPKNYETLILLEEEKHQ